MKLEEQKAWLTLAKAGKQCAEAWAAIGRELVAEYGRQSAEETVAEANAKTARAWAAEGAAMVTPPPVEAVAKMMREETEGQSWMLAAGAIRLEEVAVQLDAYQSGPLAAAAEKLEAKAGAIGFPGAKAKLAEIAAEQVRGAVRILELLSREELAPFSPSSSAAWAAWGKEERDARKRP